MCPLFRLAYPWQLNTVKFASYPAAFCRKMPRGIYPWEPKNTVFKTCAGYGVRYEYLSTATIPEVMILRDVAAGYRSIPRGIQR